MSKLTAEEIWTLALEPDIDEEYERVLAMTDDEVRASLRARGRNVRMLEVEAMVLFGLPRKQKRSNGFIGTAAAMAAASLATVGIMASEAGTAILSNAGHGTGAAATGHGAGTPATAAVPPVADTLRRDAFDSCRAGRWQECLDLLDRAKRTDPSGDRDPDVQAARAAATKALEGGR